MIIPTHHLVLLYCFEMLSYVVAVKLPCAPPLAESVRGTMKCVMTHSIGGKKWLPKLLSV